MALLTLVALLFTTLGFLGYFYKDTIIQAFEKNPENFTELYFQNYTSLPTQLPTPTPVKYLRPTKKKATFQYTFAFTIHNLENKNMKYTYEVNEIGAEKTTLDKKTVVINNGDSKTITENYTMPLTYPTTQIVVTLPNKNQHIAFWMWGKSI